MVASSNVTRCMVLLHLLWPYGGLRGAAEPPEIPGGGSELVSRDLGAMRFGAREEAQATGRIVPVTGQPFEQAWRVQHEVRPQHPWYVTLHVDIDGAIRRGDTLLLCVHMRCRSSEDESGDGVARVLIQDRTTHERIGATVVRAGKTWQHFLFPTRAEMRRHAFGFGSVVHPQYLMAQNADGDRYRDVVARYMNKAPLETGFRWQNWFRERERPRREMRDLLDQSLDWLNQHRIEVRGHYLMWAPLSPKTQPEALLTDGDLLQEALFAHMAEKSRFAGQRVQEWDAINHIIGWGSCYADLLGSRDIYAQVIRLGRELNPHAEMWINEGQVLPGGSRRAPYLDMARFLRQRGAEPDGIGFMGHFSSGSLTDMEELKQVYDEFAQLGVPLQLTELDVDTGLDEQLQADYLRDVLILSYSHPAMEAINLWGFWEGRHWRPHAALWRRDWQLKPAGEVWLELVDKQWRTSTSGACNQEGLFKDRGFFGEYAIAVNHRNKSKTEKHVLAKDSPEITVVLD